MDPTPNYFNASINNLYEKFKLQQVLMDKLIASKDAEIESMREIYIILRDELHKRNTCKFCKDCKVCRPDPNA
jgi:hypothetical protein